jgi:hypothetical protein
MPISLYSFIKKTLSPVLLLLLHACAYHPPAGQWHELDVSGVTFSGVELKKEIIDSGYPAICHEAQNEIQQQLTTQLKTRIQPLTLATSALTSAQQNNALLKIQITQCDVDVQQWDGGSRGLTFTYYLELTLNINLTQKNKTLLNYEIESLEQIDTGTSGPDFEFTFEEIIQRTLLLFDGGRFLVPHKNE